MTRAYIPLLFLLGAVVAQGGRSSAAAGSARLLWAQSTGRQRRGVLTAALLSERLPLLTCFPPISDRLPQYYTPTRAGAEDMEAFHSEDYVEFLRTVTPDNMVSEGS